MTLPTRLSIEPRAVDPAAIERGLVDLWQSARQGLGADAAVTQACMSNLLIWCTAPGDVARIAEEVPDIVERHPARVILLEPDVSDLGADIEAYVSAQCHLSDGNRQVCSEYITISACPPATRRLPSVVRPLLIGDLPTALWWAGSAPPPRAGALFRELAAMSEQVIFDSFEWTDPAASLLTAAEWIEAADTPIRAADLAWRRLKPWRRLMSQVLDPTVLPGALDAVTAVDVRHGPHGLPQALFAVGWLASCLSWQSVQQTMQPGVQVSWEFRTSRGPLRVSIVRADEGEPDVQRLRLTWQEGSTRQATFERTGPSRLVATLDDRDEAFAVLSAPRQPRAVLVAKQLPARHGDRLFDQSLRITTTIAQALV